MVFVIIPVFNNWQLTQQCLISLAGTTRNEPLEVCVAIFKSSPGQRC